MSDVTENEIAEAVARILSATVSGEASLAYLKRRVPDFVRLSASDLEESTTRKGEPLWEQRLRNIKSHYKTEGNFIAEGYLTAPSRGRLRVTEAGRQKYGPKNISP